jgi:hypothetical protein
MSVVTVSLQFFRKYLPRRGCYQSGGSKVGGGELGYDGAPLLVKVQDHGGTSGDTE